MHADPTSTDGFRELSSRHHREKPLSGLTAVELHTLDRMSQNANLLNESLREPLFALGMLASMEMSDREMRASLAEDESG
jgi:hypothetical protein